MKTLILDNFDSFTYNLFQYCAELNANPEVFRNNELTLKDISDKGFSHIIISPGPGSPDNKADFGICGEVIKSFSGKLPILGVCLGHQGIIHQFGGKIVRAKLPVHGKSSKIKIHNQSPLFKGLPNEITGMRYHSLIGDARQIPAEFDVIAKTSDDDLVMGIAHKNHPLYGVQFHPESIGTPTGKQILQNFLGIKKCDLTEDEAEQLLDDMVAGKFTEEEMAEILRDLTNKGESVSEIVGMAHGMQKHAVKMPIHGKDLMDTCGTGGSGLQRMNISTTAAFVLAACGVKIAKHGNKAASGRCGSFDLLESLGVNIQLGPAESARGIKQLGIGFLFAPNFHPAMKLIAPVRKKLGLRTIFNLIGPLTNPASPKYHLLGTTSIETAEKLVNAMRNLGYKRAMVVVGKDGLDDITLTGKTTIFELNRGLIRKFNFSPEEVGFKCVKNFDEISGGSPDENAKIFTSLLKNKGPLQLHNLLLLNCAFALLIRGLVKDIPAGMKMASYAIKSGAAYEKFIKYKDFSNQQKTGVFRKAILGKDKISIIAEIKRYSPSYGKPFPKRSVKELIKAYEKGGASAISVVTESKIFKGNLNLLIEARKSTNLPIIRKDFILTKEDINVSATAGANAILLIASKLKKEQLRVLVEHARSKNIDSVVEIYDDEDLKKIDGMEEIIVGINNRNLKNFEVNVNHAAAIIPKINAKLPIIVESAFNSPEDFSPYKGKVDAALIGTSLLTSKNPEATLINFNSYDK